jgi:two-component system, NtrC family, sensor kinase
MRTYSIKTKAMFFFTIVILFLGICVTVYAYFSIEKYLLERAQKEVENDLRMVRTVYEEELAKIRIALNVADPNQDLDILKAKNGLDYLYKVDIRTLPGIKNRVLIQAIERKETVAATRIIPSEELKQMGEVYQGRILRIRETPKARPTNKQVLDSVMSMEGARPIFDESGQVSAVIYGGKIINENFGLIKLMSDAIFDPKSYQTKPVGTVTIFQDDVRVVTTVLDKEGKPAIGTRISEVVYHKVVEQGLRWIDRAFVVTDWNLTAYEPLQDTDGKIIGVLYIGILEKPYIEIRNKRLLVFGIILGAAIFLAIFVSYLLSDSISRPLTAILRTVQKITAGDLKSKVQTDTSVKELNILAEDFNIMADGLVERERNLAISNQKLQQLNKDYLELIGFVSHELKGVLSSVVLNTYLLSDGILGEINEKQKKTLHSVARNLDYLTQTVKNFLNLSRIEKGELAVHKSRVTLKEQVFDISIDALLQAAQEKGMRIINAIALQTAVEADLDLLQIVANNLLSNAIKYGTKDGKIEFSARDLGDSVEVEVYNDGNPILDIDKEKLFRKFSRLIYNGMEKVKGTGVGLFITKEIIEKHGGKIWVSARAKGNSFIFQIPKS